MARKILIADPDTIAVEQMTNILTAQGYAVSHVSNGKAVLKWMEAERPDLLIIDTRLPKLDGFTVLERLRANPAIRDLPVVMTTYQIEDANIFRGWKLGVDTFQSKIDGVNRVFLLELVVKIKRIFKSIDEDAASNFGFFDK